MRDMTKQQFLNALKRHGMVLQGFMGYVGIAPTPHQHRHCVSYLNAGPTWRTRLAYLIREQEKANATNTESAQ